MIVRRALCLTAAAALPLTIRAQHNASANDQQQYQEDEQFVSGRQ